MNCNIYKELFGQILKHDLTCNIVEKFVCSTKDEYIVGSQDSAGTVPPTACQFSKVNNCNYLAIADEDGGIMVMDTDIQGQRSLKQDFTAHENAIFDVAWVSGEYKLLTASADKTCALWDASTEKSISEFKGHTSSVKTVAFDPDCNAVFASGSRDGHVMVWDTRVKEKGGAVPAVNVIRNPHAIKQVIAGRRKRKTDNLKDSQHGVSSLLFQDSHMLITAGSCDGDVKVWDLRKTYTGLKGTPVPREILPYAKTTGRSFGIASLALDSSRTRLFASCMDSVIYQFDCAAFNKKPVCSYKGHQMASFYVKIDVSPDDSFLLSGSSDSHAYVWQVGDPCAIPVTLQGHEKEVCDVAWCPSDVCRLVTTSDDCSMRVWKTDPRWGCETPYDPGQIIGKAYRTHRDIGISTVSTPGSAVAAVRKPSLRIRRAGSSVPSRRQSTVTSSPSLVFPNVGSQSVDRARDPRVIQSPRRPAQLVGSPRKQAHYSVPPVTQVVQSPSRNNVDCALSPSSARLLSPSPRKATRVPQSPSKALAARLNMTPKKHTVLPQRQAEISSTMKSALQSLSRDRREPTEAAGSSARKPVTLTSWLTQSKSFTCQSPKKITISPKKIVSPPPATKIHAEPPNAKSVKRKLTDCYSGDSPNCKRSKVEGENRGDSTTNHHKSDQQDSEHQGKTKCAQFSDVTNTPLKEVQTSSQLRYRSPTVNLPNYVFNPEPRTPIGRLPEKHSSKTTDWLTQIRNDRDHVTPEKAVGSAEEGNKTPVARPKTEGSKATPKSTRLKKTQLQKKMSGSILQYLSPKQ